MAAGILEVEPSVKSVHFVPTIYKPELVVQRILILVELLIKLRGLYVLADVW